MDAYDAPITTESTRATYAYGWDRFAEWCAAEGHDPNDGDPATVVAFLVAMFGRGMKPTTLYTWRAGIRHHYLTDLVLLSKGWPDDYSPTDDPAVTRAFKRMRRTAARDGRAPESTTALTPDVMERVLAVSAVRRSGESVEKATLRHLEAEAMLRLMFDSALRADEAVRACWSDLSTKPDPTTGHRTLHIPVSKTDQNGNGRFGNVSPPTWQALQRWRSASGGTGRITTASSASALSQRFKRLGAAAGVKLTGHSPRRGVATALGWDGASEQELKAVGGWKDTQTLGRYIDAPNAARNAVCRLYADDDTDDDTDGFTGSLLSRAYAGREQTFPDRMERERLEGELDMARKLGLGPDHPEVVAVRERILALWPLDDPPADCGRDGCPGLVLVANPRPADRFCCDPCRRSESKRREAASRADQ